MKLRKQFVLFIFAFILADCQKENIAGNPHFENCSFRLVLPYNALPPEKGETRALKLETYTIRYFLADEEGNVVDKKFTAYDKEEQRITIEPVVAGRYELFVLAYSPLLEQEGFVVASSLNHKSEPWVRFTKEKIGLIKNRSILFGRSSFEIQGQSQFDRDILLSHVFSSVSFDLQIPSEYVGSSLDTISVSSQGYSTFSSLSLDGSLSGKVPLEVTDFTAFPGIPVYTFPADGTESVPFTIRTETTNHEGVNYANVFKGIASLERSAHSTINVSLSKHPDAKTGLLFVRSNMYRSTVRPQILQDDESSSIYYDASQRSFRINQPLQISLTDDNRLHTRFYSPVPLSNVKIWAKHPELPEEILIAFFDTIPAFSDAKYIMRPEGGQVFNTKGGDYVQLSENQALRLKQSALSIESDDPFWRKIRSIKSKWLIRFSSYGGNPNSANGGPSGNWIGIRPVHIRESIAIWLNVGYMMTLPDFEEKLMKYQGLLYGNRGKGDWIDVKSIIPNINSLPGFNVGLTGKGVLGLGGGQTWGMAQYPYINHYHSAGACKTIFHELGHCMGYSHSSNMTYGLWAEELTNNFYTKNIQRLPVNSEKFLSSRNNTNLYR